MPELHTELTKLNEIVGAVDLPFERKSLDVQEDGTLVLSGLAGGFNVDRFNEQFDPATFRTAFERYMKSNPLVTLNHELSKVIGRLTDYRFTSQGVEVVAEIPKPDPGMSELANAYNLIKNKVLKAFSVGGRWKKVAGPDGVVKVFPQEFVEVTVAGVPVNPSTLFEVTGMKAMGGSLDDEMERLASLSNVDLDGEVDALKGLL